MADAAAAGAAEQPPAGAGQEQRRQELVLRQRRQRRFPEVYSLQGYSSEEKDTVAAAALTAVTAFEQAADPAARRQELLNVVERLVTYDPASKAKELEIMAVFATVQQLRPQLDIPRELPGDHVVELPDRPAEADTNAVTKAAYEAEVDQAKQQALGQLVSVQQRQVVTLLGDHWKDLKGWEDVMERCLTTLTHSTTEKSGCPGSSCRICIW